MTFARIEYELPEPGIARIWLNRPERRNAQDTLMLHEINQAFDEAAADDSVRVMILAARGPHFSAGHDLSETAEEAMGHPRIGTWHSGDEAGAEAHFCREKELYQGFCMRWRDMPKPVIAAVQGKVIAGGLMLIWPCDLVIASEDASFQDNTMFMGIPGVEYFAHAWELGIRRAKEFVLTGKPIDAAEALAAGMVNRVVPAEALQAEALEMARSIADKPGFALKLAKSLLNATFGAQGFDAVQAAAFNAHHLAHAHYRLTQQGSFIDRAFLERLRPRTP